MIRDRQLDHDRDLFSDTKPRKNGIEHILRAVDAENEADVIQRQAGMGGSGEKGLIISGRNQATSIHNMIQGNR